MTDGSAANFDGWATGVNRQKMSTFVSVKNTVDSRCYEEFMSTFVYLLRKGISRKIKELTSKNVYFCILLTTFHVGRGRVSVEIKGLSATDA